MRHWDRLRPGFPKSVSIFRLDEARDFCLSFFFFFLCAGLKSHRGRLRLGTCMVFIDLCPLRIGVFSSDDFGKSERWWGKFYEVVFAV